MSDRYYDDQDIERIGGAVAEHLARTHPKIMSVAKTSRLLSEKPEARGEVAVATSTRGEGFAASNSAVLGQKLYFRMGSSKMEVFFENLDTLLDNKIAPLRDDITELKVRTDLVEKAV